MAQVTRLSVVLVSIVAVHAGAVAAETAPDAPRPVNAYADVDGVWDVDPAVGTGNDRTLAVWTPVFSRCNPLVASSDDGGVTWSEPSLLKTNVGLDDGFVDNSPSVATDGNGNWIVIWVSTDTLGGTLDPNYDILAARSTDDGQSWSPPQLISETISFYSETPDLTTDGNGTWIAAWSGSGLLVARSTDNGATWEPPVHIVDGLENRHTKVATDGAGTWIVVWESNFDGPMFGNDSDILYVRSLDGGSSWSPIRAVNTNASGSNQIDQAPDLAVDASGNWVVAWEAYDAFDTLGDDFDLLYARSTDGGVTWSDPLPLNSDAADDGFGERDEQVALKADAHGRWLALWRAFKDGSGDIWAARSSDGGATWTELETLTLSGSDSDPELAWDADGNWLLVLESANGLDGTIGSDRDVLSIRLRVPFDATCAGDTDADGYAAAGDPGCPLGALADCNDGDIAVAPGAVQSCDGLNNDCLHPSWPTLAGTNEADDDADGLSECEGDCDDGDAMSWSLPAVVSGVEIGRSGPVALIAWDAPGDPGGDPALVTYDVVRAEAPFTCNRIGPQSCIESDDGSDRSAEDSLVPDPGAVFFYQVRAENGCGGIGRLGLPSPTRLRTAIDCP